MPDTGAPWNIPYADPTDLVRDWPDLSEDVAEAVAAGLSSIPVLPGIGSNVVQTVKTDVFTSTSTSFTAVDGLTATITPSSESSKVLVIGTIQGASLESSGSSRNFGRLVRGSTAIGIGDAEGSRTQATVNISTRDAGAFNVMSATAVLLDSPSSTTATTYGWQVVTPAGITLYVNRAQDDNNDNQRARLISTITLIEVAE